MTTWQVGEGVQFQTLVGSPLILYDTDNFNNDCVLWTLFLRTTEATESVLIGRTLRTMSLIDLFFFLTVLCCCIYNLPLCLSSCPVWRINVFIQQPYESYDWVYYCIWGGRGYARISHCLGDSRDNQGNESNSNCPKCP